MKTETYTSADIDDLLHHLDLGELGYEMTAADVIRQLRKLDDLMHPRDVAKRYNMTPESLSNWRREGKGPPFIRLGKGKSPRVMYRVRDVINYEEQNLTNTN